MHLYHCAFKYFSFAFVTWKNSYLWKLKLYKRGTSELVRVHFVQEWIMNKFIDSGRRLIANRTFLLSAYPFPRDYTLDEPEILSLARTARDLSGKLVISRLADRPSPRRNIAPKFDFRFHSRGVRWYRKIMNTPQLRAPLINSPLNVLYGVSYSFTASRWF